MMKKISLAASKSTSVRKQQGFHPQLSRSARKTLCQFSPLVCDSFIHCPDSAEGVTPGFRCGSAGKQSTCNVGDLGSIPGLGRSPGEGKGYPLQYSGLENSMDRTVHGAA